jgi:hypothetical protein
MLRTYPATPGDGFTLDTTADALVGTPGAGMRPLTGMRVNIGYRAADPFAVTLDIANPAGWTSWTLDRDLLADGMTTPAGLGDILITPTGTDTTTGFGGRILIELSSPNGYAALTFSRAVLDHVLDQIEDLVPAGTEWDRIDFDTALTAGLGGGAR